MVWYADGDQLYLVPDSLVFVGKNAERSASDDGDDRWYFQDTDSYCTKGMFTSIPPSPSGKSDEISVRVYRLRKDELTQVVDCEGLRAELAQCSERRSRAKG
jgi:hypothetical protein